MNKSIVALGADIKNRILYAKGKSFNFGVDIGDLSIVDNFLSFQKQVRRAIKAVGPSTIAYDLHPHYFSSQFIKSLQPSTFKLQPVQHHHAHIASAIQEYGIKKPVIGVAFDGTGFGSDGKSWGGEFLLVNGAQSRRLGFLKYRKMPGGDKVVYEPWRMAVSILGEQAFPFLKAVNKEDKISIMRMISKNINCPDTSSAGRLFDAAAALIGICPYASYEAEGPIKLETLCESRIKGRYTFNITKEKDWTVVDTDSLFIEMGHDLKRGFSKQIIATKFHNSMAAIIIQMVKKLSKAQENKTIALSGGVFQNKYLKTKVIEGLSVLGFSVFTNRKVPVNDLNISLGQYYVSCRTSTN